MVKKEQNFQAVLSVLAVTREAFLMGEFEGKASKAKESTGLVNFQHSILRNSL